MLKMPRLVIRGDQLGAVFVLRPKTGPWSGSNELGWSTQFNGDINNVQSALKLPEWGEPEVWTLSLGMHSNILPVGSVFDVEARIWFGAGGTTQYVICDWQDGTMLSMPMNALAVQAAYSANAVHLVPSDLQLFSQIARGSRGGDCPPQKTYRVVVLPGAFSTPVRIPPFARKVDVLSIGTTQAELDDLYHTGNLIEFWSPDTPPMFGQQTVSADRIPEFYAGGGIPIPAHARYVRYNNTFGTGGITQTVVFIFKLGL